MSLIPSNLERRRYGFTTVSLNDRFTILQNDQISRPAEPETQQIIRPTVRPRTLIPRAARVPMSNVSNSSSSFRNRNVNQLLDLKQKIQAALRLKRRSVRGNVTKQTLSNRLRNRTNMKRSPNTIRLGPSGRLRRARSMTNIRTMQADYVGFNMARSNSSTDITARLGVRPQTNANGSTTRRRINRSNFPNPRRRSVSRNRSNSQVQLKRSTSQVNVHRPNPRQQRRRPTNARLNQRFRQNTQNKANGINSRRIRANSQNRNGRIIKGRVFKRRNSVAGVQNNVRANQIRGRSRSRVGRGNGAARSVSRGRINRQGNNNKNNLQNRSRRNNAAPVGAQRRSRSRQRKRGASVKKVPIKTKEELDQELDQYMVNTKNTNEIDDLLGKL